MYDRVLHPTDGSDEGAVATDHALAIARRFDAPLHVVFVVETAEIQSTDAFATSNYESTYEAMAAAGESRIESVVERAEDAGVPVTSDVLEGKPATTIVEATRDGDVVVMATHGRSGLDRYLIGSTTENVVRTADVPVVTVPMADESAGRP